MNKQSQTIRQRAKMHRTAAGMTQEQLAEAASISVETVQRLERTGHVGLKTIAAVARALKIEPSVLSLPHEPMVIACMSEKGGVGRTTLTFNLSVLLASLGHSVCAVQIGKYDPIVEECLAERRRPLPKLSSCWLPDADVLDDWLGGPRSFSHILIDAIRYRPDLNKILISRAGLLLIPIVHLAMEEGALDILMAQISDRRPLREAPILLVFSQNWTNEGEYLEDLSKIEKRYKRLFPSIRITQRKVFGESENGTLHGPLNTPVLTPRARDARKACQELAMIWSAAERTVRDGTNSLPCVAASEAEAAFVCSSLIPIRSRRPKLSALGRALKQIHRQSIREKSTTASQQ